MARVVVKDRVCTVCGAVFQGGPKALYCPPCRLEINQERNRQYKRDGSRRKLGSIDHCTVCGAEYIVESGTQKYCPNCAPDAIRAVDLIASKAWNAKYATPEYRRALRDMALKPRICVICGTEFLPHNNAVTCSAACSNLLKKQTMQEFERTHREERNARKRSQAQEKIAAMTPEEYAAYRAKINERARENYKKRKEKQQQID